MPDTKEIADGRHRKKGSKLHDYLKRGRNGNGEGMLTMERREKGKGNNRKKLK